MPKGRTHVGATAIITKTRMAWEREETPGTPSHSVHFHYGLNRICYPSSVCCNGVVRQHTAMQCNTVLDTWLARPTWRKKGPGVILLEFSQMVFVDFLCVDFFSSWVGVVTRSNTRTNAHMDRKLIYSVTNLVQYVLLVKEILLFSAWTHMKI
jgi:hypothetical protein